MMELLRELYDVVIFASGTCTNNCITNELTTEKRSPEYKEMSRGDFNFFVYVKFVGGEADEQRYGWLNHSQGPILQYTYMVYKK